MTANDNPIGNRTQTSDSFGTRAYTHNALNEMLSDSRMPRTYDADGNLVFDWRFEYAWDAENRLVSATPVFLGDDAHRVRNEYDHLSRRVTKHIDVWNAAAETWTAVQTHTFVYDGWNPILETVVDHASHTTNVIQYLWGLDLSETLQGAGGVGGLLAVVRDGATYLPCYDANGNVTEYVSESGTVVAAYVYDAFGNVLSATGSMADTFSYRFSTKYWDEETGLYYYGYRFYSTEMGRWMNRDPIEERGGVGLYSFCKNASMSLTDKLGLIWKITRNATNNWAAAEATDSSDTFDSLARTLHFDPAEIEKWSNGTILLGSTPRIGCKYSIPNVYVFFTSSRKWTDITLVVTLYQHKVKEMAVISAFSGFKTKVYFNSSNRNDFIQAWNINGLAGFFFAGHGNGAGMILQESPEISVFPDEVSPKDKLSIGHFYACDSKHSSMIFGRWQNYVAIEAGGDFKGFSGDAYLWTDLEGPSKNESEEK